MTEDCPFCKLDRDCLDQTANMMLIESKYPVIEKGHFLIIPMRHIESCYDLTPNEWNELRILMKSARDFGLNELGLTDSNCGFNDGALSGQTVFHAHFHIIMRKKGDVNDPRGGIRNIIPKKGNYLK